MFGIRLPSVSEVKNAVKGAASTALHTSEDLGSSALSHAASLGRSGLDLGRSAVIAASHVDVQALGSAAIGGVGRAEHWAESGLQTGVMKAGQGVHSAAGFARSHVPGDNPLSKAARGLITAGEDYTRFDIGVVGGVGKAAAGLVGSAGQLGVLAAEYQASPSARAQIDAKVAGGVADAAKSAFGYADSVAHDPTRLVGDAAHAAGAAGGWVEGEAKSAGQAIRDGHGLESFGMQVGNATTYLIPVGGEARLAAEGGELATRGLVAAAARDGAEDLARAGATRAIPAISDIARAGIPKAAERTGLSDAQIARILETPKGARPSPETYLSASYREAALKAWDDGAVRFTSRSSFEARGTLGPPHGFTIPASTFDQLVRETAGDTAKIEEKLGLDPGYLSDADTMIVHVKPEDMKDLQLPSGNEPGANANWLPGGYTSGGMPEATLDFPNGTPYTEITLKPGR